MGLFATHTSSLVKCLDSFSYRCWNRSWFFFSWLVSRSREVPSQKRKQDSGPPSPHTPGHSLTERHLGMEPLCCLPFCSCVFAMHGELNSWVDVYDVIPLWSSLRPTGSEVNLTDPSSVPQVRVHWTLPVFPQPPSAKAVCLLWSLSLAAALGLDPCTECCAAGPGPDPTRRACLLLPGGASSAPFNPRQKRGPL